jgi:hypothetical protein
MQGLGSCWLWQGARRGPKRNEYGQFWAAGKAVAAHRYAYGPTDLKVLHHCDTPLCVRRSHLFEGTTYDNVHDMINKGRGHAGRYAARVASGTVVTAKEVRRRMVTTTAERKSSPTQVRISLVLREQVKVRAAQEKMTMQAFVDAAVAAALAQ